MNYARITRFRCLYQMLSKLHQDRQVVSKVTLTSAGFSAGQVCVAKNMSTGSESYAKFQELRKKASERPKEMTNSEWQELLDVHTFYVTREKGTERPFSSLLNDEKDPGIFACACCHQPLFDSKTVSFHKNEFYCYNVLKHLFRNSILELGGQVFSNH